MDFQGMSPEQVYEQYKPVVERLVDSRGRHDVAAPDCPGHPICVGEEAGAAFLASCSAYHEFPLFTTLVAVGELADCRRRLASLESELEKTVRAGMAAEADLLAAQARIDELEEQLASVLAALTIAEEADDRD